MDNVEPALLSAFESMQIIWQPKTLVFHTGKIGAGGPHTGEENAARPCLDSGFYQLTQVGCDGT